MKEKRMQLYTWTSILLALALIITHTGAPHPLAAASTDGVLIIRRDTTNVLEQTPGSEGAYTLALPADLKHVALDPGHQKADKTVAITLQCQKRCLQAETVALER